MCLQTYVCLTVSLLLAHEAALHTARLRVELSQSRAEQKDYLRQVELARVLEKRKERKRKAGVEEESPAELPQKSLSEAPKPKRQRKLDKSEQSKSSTSIDNVINRIF
jgi:ESF2/ABP1 family protein